LKRIEYRIEEVKYEELYRVKEINESTLPENYPFYFYETLYKNYGKAFYVAKVEDRIVGYVMCRVEKELTLDPLPRFKKVGHIVSIAVLPEYRNMGIGTELMKRALETLRSLYNAENVYLEVRVSNTGAIRLYHKLGFKISRRIAGYYRDGEDAYIMTIDFKEGLFH